MLWDRTESHPTMSLPKKHDAHATSPPYDVAIVGAGPAGSTIAVALAGLGWHVLLVEREKFPRHKVCGEFISPEAQSVLHHFGLHQEIDALDPVPIHETTVVSLYGQKLQRPLPGQAWGLSRYRFDAGLAEAAISRGVELRTATTATRIETQEGRVRLHLRHRDESTWVEARTAIMAYGRSALPGLATEHHANHAHARFVGAKCHYTGVRMAKQVEIFFFPGGYAGINPIEGERVNLCVLASYSAFVRAGSSVSGILEAAIAGNEALAQKMSGATALLETECAVAPVDTQRPAQIWGVAAHIGDSAVMLPPLCGDGMAMALRSAELCVPLADAYLRGTISLAAWQERYEFAWKHEFARRVWLGRHLQKLLQVPVVAESMLLTGSLIPVLADYFITSTRGAIPSATPSLPSPTG
jgi:flavin-dependent dehydrogenase